MRVAAVYFIIFLPLVTTSQVQFTDVTSSKGFPTFGPASVYGSGISAVDHDEDGDIDLYISSDESSANMLYRNLGEAGFELVESAVSISMNSRMSLWFDYNGDHLLDLLVAGDCNGATGPCPDTDRIKLFKQLQDGSFEDVSEESGLTSGNEVEGFFGGMAAGDLNNDGYLDLVMDYWDGNVFLFHNNGNGTFTDISEEKGVSQLSDYWQPMIFDLSGNGWSDLYLTVDNNANRLWKNSGNGSFEEVSKDLGLDNSHNDMGICLGDFDNDDDLDIYITNIERDLPGKHNALFENKSNGEELFFEEVSKAVGVSAGGWGWGITFMDADNDMLLDLAATNGPVDTYTIDDKSKLWKNNGDLSFTDISTEARFNTNLDATTLISFDYDRDGDLDLVQTLKKDQDPVAIKLFENQLTSNVNSGNYLVVKPRMGGANHWAIGSKVSIKIGSVTQSRAITAGNSFYGQEPAEAFFGLGENTIIDEVSVVWPGGVKSVVTNVTANQLLTVEDLDVLHSPGLLTAALSESLSAELNWGHMTSNEIQFFIERSEHEDFRDIMTFDVDASNHSYIDETLPETGTFYYRVKASDGEVESGYSNVVSISADLLVSGMEEGLDFAVYPNPTTGSINIAIPNNPFDQLELQLVSISGKIIEQWSYRSIASPAHLSVQTSALVGIYFLRLVSEGQLRGVKKISVRK